MASSHSGVKDRLISSPVSSPWSRTPTPPSIRRAYTIASEPGQPIEFFITRVDEGELSGHLVDLPVGSPLWVRRTVSGLFTRKNVSDASVLWLMGTRTGLAPYISMLRHGKIFERHDHVVVVHGVNHRGELAYLDELKALCRAQPLTWIPCVADEDIGMGYHGSILQAFTSGALDELSEKPLNGKHAHAMLCRDPAMVKKMMILLARRRQMPLYKPHNPGRVTIECYW